MCVGGEGGEAVVQKVGTDGKLTPVPDNHIWLDKMGFRGKNNWTYHGKSEEILS